MFGRTDEYCAVYDKTVGLMFGDPVTRYKVFGQGFFFSFSFFVE